MEEKIFYNMKPKIENHKTIWEEDKCECGTNKIKEVDEIHFKCVGCGKIIEKWR